MANLTTQHAGSAAFFTRGARLGTKLDPPVWNRDNILKLFNESGFTCDRAPQDFEAIVAGLEYAGSHIGIGLMISGAAGTGKTFAIRSTFPRTAMIAMSEQSDVDRLTRQCDDDPYINRLVTNNNDLMIDDLGCERIKNDYGVKSEIFSDFLCQWYQHKISIGIGRLLITTNLNGDQLLERYGERVMDRIEELCAVVKFTAMESQRIKHPIFGGH